MSKTLTAPVVQSPLHSYSFATQAAPMNANFGVWANEMPLLGFISLRGEAHHAPFLEATEKVLGLPLPIEPCTLTQSGNVTALWLSPDEWMIVCPRERLESLMRPLERALTGMRSQVADNSGGYTQVMVQGTNARDVLSHCTVYDLDKLGEGRVVGTTFGKSSVYLRRAEGGYCLLLRRSFADYIWRYLVRAARPYGLGILKLPDPGAGS